jgi:hypothetical protein
MKSRSFSANGSNGQQPPPPIIVTMKYYGRGIKLDYDTELFESKDEITIYQQHCGGENLLVYSGLHHDDDKFSFVSKRHKEFPFSLTIFINGTYDSRISTCCEYRHKLNVRIGGKTGRFGLTNVSGDQPCVKCLIERANDKGKTKKVKPEEKDIQVIPDDDKNGHYSFSDEERKKLEITVNHGEFKWSAKLFSLKSNQFLNHNNSNNKNKSYSSFESSDSQDSDTKNNNADIVLKIIGTKCQTNDIKIDCQRIKNDPSDNNYDFLINNDIGIPETIIIQQLNTKSKQFLQKLNIERIELKERQENKVYLFDHVIYKGPFEINFNLKNILKQQQGQKWQIKVTTSDLKGKAFEGTDSQVYISLISNDNDEETIKYQLDKSICINENKNKDLFETGETDEFILNNVPSNIGNNLRGIRIGHDNSGFAPAWHLNKVELIDDKSNYYLFNCKKWFSLKDDGQKIERCFYLNSNNGATSSDDSRNSKTKRYSTQEIKNHLNDSRTSSRHSHASPKIVSSQTRKLSVSSFESDNKNSNRSSVHTKKSSISSIDSFNDKNKLKKSSSSATAATSSETETETEMEPWTVHCFTSNLNGKAFEGTNSRVYISVFNPNNNKEMKKIFLNDTNSKLSGSSKNKKVDLFEAGEKDSFTINLPSKIKKIQKIKIGHDNSGFSSGWHLEKVQLVSPNRDLYVFECNRWLADNEDDGKIERILTANQIDRKQNDSVDSFQSKSSHRESDKSISTKERPHSKNSKKSNNSW